MRNECWALREAAVEKLGAPKIVSPHSFHCVSFDAATASGISSAAATTSAATAAAAVIKLRIRCVCRTAGGCILKTSLSRPGQRPTPNQIQTKTRPDQTSPDLDLYSCMGHTCRVWLSLQFISERRHCSENRKWQKLNLSLHDWQMSPEWAKPEKYLTIRKSQVKLQRATLPPGRPFISQLVMLLSIQRYCHCSGHKVGGWVLQEHINVSQTHTHTYIHIWYILCILAGPLFWTASAALYL